MEVLLKAMDSMGIGTPDQDQQAADFMIRLNDRYASRATAVENNCRLCEDYPKTLFDAYRMISELADAAPFNSTTSSVFYTFNTCNHRSVSYAE
jgi:hypothetical protein